GGGPRGSRGRTGSPAATCACSSTTCSRPTRGWTSTSCAAAGRGPTKRPRTARGSPDMAPGSTTASTADAVVIGSGAFGASTAYPLTPRGPKGALVDPHAPGSQ